MQIMDFFRENVAKDGARATRFFHGILLGLLSVKTSWIVASNRESGNGFSDILIEIEDEALGMVLEIKYTDDGNLEAGCKKAMQQIENMRYVEELTNNGMEHILKYGIACFKKSCRIVLEE
ncbi:MAG: PD-(D/E)XK nuclease domain-containing protein [Lachnospiraceae bacterium]|nr:PD-(D/E)XK nuclease domain-containing protein [Lachnospiraceae bacterium]